MTIKNLVLKVDSITRKIVMVMVLVIIMEIVMVMVKIVMNMIIIIIAKIKIKVKKIILIMINTLKEIKGVIVKKSNNSKTVRTHIKIVNIEKK